MNEIIENYNRGLFEKARNNCVKALQKYNFEKEKSTEIIYIIYESSFILHDPEKGINIIQKYKKKFNEVDFLFYLGRSYQNSENFELSEIHYIKALSYDPDNVNLKYYLATLYYDNNQINNAIILFESIIENDVGIIYAYLSLCYAYVKNTNKAYLYLKKADLYNYEKINEIKEKINDILEDLELLNSNNCEQSLLFPFYIKIIPG